MGNEQSSRADCNELAFFTVMFSTDLWNEFRKWMYPNKLLTNFDNYRNGDAAVYYNYVPLIKHNKNLFFTNYSLEHSIIKKDLFMLKILVEHRNMKLQVDMVNLAAAYGYLSIIKYMHSINPFHNAIYAMHNAAIGGYLNVLKWLHENRVRNSLDKILNIPLEKGYLDIVRFLYSIGATIYTAYPLEIAVKYGHINIVKFLVLEVKEECTKSVICLAITCEHVEILDFILSQTKYTGILPIVDDNAKRRSEIIEVLIKYNRSW